MSLNSRRNELSNAFVMAFDAFLNQKFLICLKVLDELSHWSKLPSRQILLSIAKRHERNIMI